MMPIEEKERKEADYDIERKDRIEGKHPDIKDNLIRALKKKLKARKHRKAVKARRRNK